MSGGRVLRIMGIDPGIATVGFGIVDSNGPKQSFVRCGVITTPAGTPLSSRLDRIYSDMGELISTFRPDAAAVDPSVFTTEEEKSLIKTLSQLPETIRLSARDYDPSHVNRYLTTLAGEFHRFYNSCRIKGEAPEVLAARLKLSDTVRAVIANCLALLGVSAPEKM